MVVNSAKLEQLVRNALIEDVGDGDHSTLSCIPADKPGKARLLIKESGILAGVEIAAFIFKFMEPSVQFKQIKQDGQPMEPGELAFEINASMHTLLKGERLVLNIMQRMSGIATLTHQFTEKIKAYPTTILDTRKTTPNFRLLEKEAVRIGGGGNHRMGLYDMIMLKDNHIDFAGGLEAAIEKAWMYVQLNKPGLKIEVETRNLEEVKRVLKTGKANRIMLDNFLPDEVQEAVNIINGACETEASGGINLNNLEAYAQTGVNFISAGALIHQARSLDLSLKAVV